MVDTTAPAAPDTPTGTDDKTFNAYAFLNDLATNAGMKTEWTGVLTKVKATFPSDGSTPAANVAKNGLEALDNVIAEWGYDTTAVDVLGILKTPFWEAYQSLRQPNAQSDRFVQDLMSDPDKAAEWSRKTGAIQGADTSSLDTYLKGAGYDCNAQQVSASFDKMRNQNLNYWTGVYGDTTLKLISPAAGGSSPGAPADGAAAPADPPIITGLALTVYGSGSIGLGAMHVFDFVYARGQLTWSLGKSDDVGSNQTQASLTFSQLSQVRKDDPSGYVGNVSSGTLTLTQALPLLPPPASDPHHPALLQPGTYAFSGKVGSPAAASAPPRIPPAIKAASVDKMHEFLSQVLFYGGLAMMAHFVLKETGLSSKISQKFEEMKSKANENADSMKDNFDEGADGDTNLDLTKPTSQARIDQMKAEGASAEDVSEAEADAQAAEDEAAAADEAEASTLEGAPDSMSTAAEGAGEPVEMPDLVP